LIFSGLHGVISQKIELFITFAMRISNHTIIFTSAIGKKGKAILVRGREGP
jgi:hypothetical protein